MNSDMSSLIKLSSESNRYSARARASSVFPIPVGPRKMNEPIGRRGSFRPARARRTACDTVTIASSCPTMRSLRCRRDRKSTRLNSSHTVISYAVFCLKKKKTAHPYKHRNIQKSENTLYRNIKHKTHRQQNKRPNYTPTTHSATRIPPLSPDRKQ